MFLYLTIGGATVRLVACPSILPLLKAGAEGATIRLAAASPFTGRQIALAGAVQLATEGDKARRGQ